MAYAPPNPKRVAFEQRKAAQAAEQQQEIARCYAQYLTPQERAARDARRLAQGRPVRRRGRR